MSTILETTDTLTIETSSGLPLHRITVEDYEKMIDHGILGEDDRVELLDGVIIEMSPKKTKHATLNDRIAEFLIVNFAGKAIVRNQNPIILNNYSEPEPDIVLARPPAIKYRINHPAPDDVMLVVEISDTSVRADRLKSLNYARAGIRQYLLFNVNTDEIEDYRVPGPEGYTVKEIHKPGESFSLDAFPETNIKVSNLFFDE
jgi:Uma2 family endonuclease